MTRNSDSGDVEGEQKFSDTFGPMNYSNAARMHLWVGTFAALLLVAACGGEEERAAEFTPQTSPPAATTTTIPERTLKAAGDYYIEIVTPMNCVTRALSNAVDDFAADAGDFESVDQVFAALRQSVFPEAEKLSVVMLRFVRDMKTYDWPGPVKASVEGMINETLKDAETWASYSRLSTIGEVEQWELTPNSDSRYSAAIRKMLDLPALDESDLDTLECPEDVVATSLVDPPYIATSQQSPIDVGQDHYCVVLSDSSIACWGNNDDGQVSPPAGSFQTVSVGLRHSCGILKDAGVVCWGNDEDGQASPPAGSFRAISAGGRNTCGLHADFTISCWGAEGSERSELSDEEVAAVSTGSFHTCGILIDSRISCSGSLVPPSRRFISVSVGLDFACGIRTDSTLACWGKDDQGKATPPTGTFIAVSAGSWHACGIRPDLTVVCWGDDKYGQAAPPQKPFTSVAAGAWYSCGISTGSGVICWGSVKNGQGVTPTTSTNSPPKSYSIAPIASSSSPPTTPAPPPQTTQPSSSCHPSYTPCVPYASDVDCAGGGGDGPVFVRGPIYVIGSDVYRLDGNNDGVACE